MEQALFALPWWQKWHECEQVLVAGFTKLKEHALACLWMCICLTHVNAGICDISAVCVCLLCWWQWGEVDLMSVLKPKSVSCSNVHGEVLTRVVCRTLCLCGFSCSLQAVSGFCIWPCGGRKNFSGECILRKLHKKASLFDSKLWCNLPWNSVLITFIHLLLSHKLLFVLECTTGLGYGGIQE